jgi:hypothetical protein
MSFFADHAGNFGLGSYFSNMEEQHQHPEPLAFLRSIFPRRDVVLLSSIVDQEKLAHAEQPHRFDLKKVGDIFNDFKAALAMVPEEMALAKGKLITGRTVVGYDCEGLRYDGAYFTEKHHYKGQSQINHHIKLANDGFLYMTATMVEVGLAPLKNRARAPGPSPGSV